MNPIVIGIIFAFVSVGLSYFDGKVNEKIKTTKDYIVLFIFMLLIGSLGAYIYYNYSNIDFSGGETSSIMMDEVVVDDVVVKDIIDTGLPDF